MNPKYDGLDVPQPKSRSVPGCVVLFVAVVAIGITIGVVSHFLNGEDTISFELNVTVFDPARFGIAADTCDMTGKNLEITSAGDDVVSFDLGVGEAFGTEGDNACRFSFSAEINMHNTLRASVPDSTLPAKFLDRIPDRIFDFGDGPLLIWEIWWEP